MANFAIACSNCGKYAEVKKGFLGGTGGLTGIGSGVVGTGLLGTGIFGNKSISCNCGQSIHIDADKMAVRDCPHCGNTVMYDQSKGESTYCPICKGTVNTLADAAQTACFSCPQCNCNLQTDKQCREFDCPICGMERIDAQQRMGLFNISASGIAGVIKYEGDNNTFIWKHPVTNFNFGSQLIVHESQEAVFFMNGQALDLFPPGRHTLETQNLPLVGEMFAAPTGGVTPFHCEVYFINKTEQLAIKWGTSEHDRVEFVEPAYGFPIKIGASGEMSLRVEDSRKLLVKIVGTEKGITQQCFVQKMRAFLILRVKNFLAAYIKRERINIFEIDEHLITLSEALHEQFLPDFSDYGVSMERFLVTTIVKPEDDHNYRRFKELHFRQYADVAEARLRQQTGIIEQETQKARMILEAEGMAHKRALEGYTYQDERGFDVAERVAANEAVGQVRNLGVGLGIMAGVGGAVGSTVGDIMKNTMGQVVGGTKPAESAKINESETICPACGIKTPKGKFCLDCGTALIKKCSECNTEIPAGGKFCLECGHKI